MDTYPMFQISVTKGKEFERIFTRFDADGDGKISPVELQLLMGSIGEELDLEDAEALVESFDSDGDGLLNFADFVSLASIEGEGDEHELMEAFKMYRMEGEGCITTKSLRRMLSQLGASRDMDECKAMICRFDLNGDGVLSFEEFRLMMHRDR